VTACSRATRRINERLEIFPDISRETDLDAEEYYLHAEWMTQDLVRQAVKLTYKVLIFLHVPCE